MTGAVELIEVEQHDAVALVRLNRPEKRNALSIAVRDAVSDALDDLAARDDVSVVVITGRDGVFSAGFDLREFEDPAPEHQRRLWASSDRFHRTVIALPIPAVAAVDGPAIAGGFDLACMCDLRVVTPTVRFAHPERRWGPVIYSLLHDLVGGARARDLVLTGRELGADEAERIGLVSRVVASDALLDVAMELARDVAETPRSLLVDTKAKIRARSGIDPTTATLAL